jgi:hypothetical protein
LSPEVFEDANSIYDQSNDCCLGSRREARFLVTTNPPSVAQPNGTREILGVAFHLKVGAAPSSWAAMMDHVVATYAVNNNHCITLFHYRSNVELLSHLFVYRSFEWWEFTTIVKLSNLVPVNAFASPHLYSSL